jgi:hypothetical protein
MNASSTALRTQKGSCGEEQCCMILPLLCLLGVGALLFAFSSLVPATWAYTTLLNEASQQQSTCIRLSFAAG